MDFHPLVPNPHVLTILGNYWPRRFNFSPFPIESQFVETEPHVRVLVQTQRPPDPRAELVLLHGLEGSGESGYMISLAYHALTHGFTVHRFHMRTCGGTEQLCTTLYHGGLTSDLISFLTHNHAQLPLFLAGFSLGGNVALKAAAEAGPALLAGAISVSAPIDLAESCTSLHKPQNRLYENRFVDRMKQRLVRTGRYTMRDLAQLRTIYDIDDQVTAPSFGFRSADHYYETQSALRFIPQIRIPVLMITAQDDTLIPFASYRDPAIQANPCIQLIAPHHGGHLGFLSRRTPRFWADQTILHWLDSRLAAVSPHPPC